MNIITPEARLSYPSLFKPRKRADNPNQEPRYEAVLVFDAGTDLTALKRAAVEVAKARWGDDAAKMIKAGTLRMPFRTDGEEKYGPGTTFISVWSNDKPGLVDRYAGPDGKPVPITDPAVLYAGCKVRASVRAFAYPAPGRPSTGNKGVSFGLQNLQKLGEGERLDNRVVLDAAEEFEATEKAPVPLPVASGIVGKSATAVSTDDLAELLS
jgi:hypothetical protein